MLARKKKWETNLESWIDEGSKFELWEGKGSKLVRRRVGAQKVKGQRSECEGSKLGEGKRPEIGKCEGSEG